MGNQTAATLVAAAMAFIVAPPPASAAEWALTAISADGSKYEADLGSVTRAGPVVQSWIRETLPRPGKAPETGRPYVVTVTRRMDDCANRRFALTTYVRTGADGLNAASGDNGARWADIPPGTVAEAVWRHVCKITGDFKDEPYVSDLWSGRWSDRRISADKSYYLSFKMDDIVRVKGDLVLAASRTEYVKPELIDGLEIKYILSAAFIDCASRTTAIAGGDLYVGPRTRVSEIRSSVDQLKFEPVTPGSFIDQMFTQICAAATGPGLEDKSEDADALSVGTGWGVSKGYVVTANHVVAGGKSISVYSNGDRIGSAKVVAADPANDLAVLKLSSSTRKILILPIADRGVSLGRTVFTLGYPEPGVLGQHIKMTAGEISSTAGAEDDARYLQISVPIQPGNSGGPLLAWDGTVLGVVEAKLTKFDDEGSSPRPEMVNYALKASYIRPLLEDLPDLGNYARVKPGLQADALVGEARKAVFMIVVQP
jgi:S1-C subfamily serine protease